MARPARFAKRLPTNVRLAAITTLLASCPAWSAAIAQNPPIVPGDVAPAPLDEAATQAEPVEQADEAWLKARIDELNAQDLATRDHAQLSLVTNDAVRLSQIEDVLDTADLSPEQRLRLGAVGLRMFIDLPASSRPAMGVEFGTRMGMIASVTINNTVPGFDAGNSLTGGDVILRMDGIPVQDFNHARQIILSFDPEEQITISVLRNGEPIDALVRFGSFAQLPNPTSPSTDLLGQAWSIRRARRAPDRAEPIIVALDPSLQVGDPALWPQVSAQTWHAVSQWIARRLEGGVEFARDRMANQQTPDDAETGPDLLPAGSQRTVDAAATEPFNNRPVTPQMAAQLRNADARVAALQREYRGLQQKLQDPNLPANVRAVHMNRARAIQGELASIRDWRRKLVGN